MAPLLFPDLVFWILFVLAVGLVLAAMGPWEFLGERQLTKRSERDTVVVAPPCADFRILKVKILNTAVDLHCMEVHFRNGTRQQVDLRAAIPTGGRSLEISLGGEARAIRSIDLWYDTASLGDRGGLVRLFAKR
jgi:hypothetical protein